MIQSMTGYGRETYSGGEGQLTVEIKAVNHRYCEVQVKLPRRFAPMEERLRQYMAEALDRGKVDLYIKADSGDSAGQAVQMDDALAAAYYTAVHDLAKTLEVPMTFGVAELVGLPGVLRVTEQEEEPEAMWQALLQPVEGALAQLMDMRRTEGARLAADFRKRLAYMEESRQRLLAYASAVVENYRKRLTSRIEELLGKQPVDESRLAQEVAMFADKASVDEELTRLDSHLRQFGELLEADEPVGRKLDFLCQEINREVNTIGSKANDLDMTKIVVDLKSELEKLREQVQNIR